MDYYEEQQRLQHQLGFSNDDLVANREGWLSESQRDTLEARLNNERRFGRGCTIFGLFAMLVIGAVFHFREMRGAFQPFITLALIIIASVIIIWVIPTRTFIRSKHEEIRRRMANAGRNP